MDDELNNMSAKPVYQVLLSICLFPVVHHRLNIELDPPAVIGPVQQPYSYSIRSPHRLF
jgi:hypothetical protein